MTVLSPTECEKHETIGCSWCNGSKQTRYNQGARPREHTDRVVSSLIRAGGDATIDMVAVMSRLTPQQVTATLRYLQDEYYVVVQVDDSLMLDDNYLEDYRRKHRQEILHPWPQER